MQHRFRTVRRVGAGAIALAALGAAAGTAMANHTEEKTSIGDGSDTASSVRVMTWNTCADNSPKYNPLCPNGQNTKKVVSGIHEQMQRAGDLNAVFLQEICKADVDALTGRDDLKGWRWGFSHAASRGSGSSQGELKPRKCTNNRGDFGVAVGVKDDDAKFTEHRYAIKHVPNARDVWGNWNVQESAMCADGLGTRFCSTHLTPWKGGHHWSDEKASEFLTSQSGEAQELADLGKGRSQLVMGGDFNSAPKDTFTLNGNTVGMLDPLYK